MGAQGPEAAGEGSATACQMFFPMYMVRAADMLSMRELRPHEQLKAEGIVVAFDPTCMVAVFVSHQWASRRHPDPTIRQFEVLQEVARRASERTLVIEKDFFTRFSTAPQWMCRPRSCAGSVSTFAFGTTSSRSPSQCRKTMRIASVTATWTRRS